jgi:hypothetical protein
LLFLNKKKQKDFLNLGLRRPNIPSCRRNSAPQPRLSSSKFAGSCRMTGSSDEPSPATDTSKLNQAVSQGILNEAQAVVRTQIEASNAARRILSHTARNSA